jgi:AcrR family transcriptional regulator
MIDKKEHILNIAEELFAEHGYEGTSTRMLALKASVNVAMISYYFGSKEKLFEALLDRKTTMMREKVLTAIENETDPWKRIDNVVDIYAERRLSNSRFHSIIHRELTLQQRPEIANMITELLMKNAKEFIKIIRDGQKKKVFRDNIDVELTVTSMIGTITQTTQQSLLSEKLLNRPDESSPEYDNYKTRVKKHVKDLLRAHLQIVK